MSGDTDKKLQAAKTETVRPSGIFDDIDATVREVEGPAVATRSGDKDLERRNSILETLLEVSASINSTLNLEELLKQIVDAVVRTTGGNRGFLMLTDEKSGELVPALARSQEGEDLSPDAFDVSVSVVRRVADSGEPMYISNVGEEDDLKDQRSIVDLNIMTVICIPLQF